MTFTKLFFDADRDLDGLLSGSISPIFAGLQHATSQASGRVHPRFDVVERDVSCAFLYFICFLIWKTMLTTLSILGYRLYSRRTSRALQV